MMYFTTMLHILWSACMAFGWHMDGVWFWGLDYLARSRPVFDTLVLYAWARGGYWMVEGVYDLDMTVALKYIQEIFADFCLR